MRLSRTASALIASASLVAAAGCGSTVNLGASGTTVAGGTDSLGQPLGTAASGGASSTSATGSSAATATGTNAGTASSTDSATTSSDQGSASATSPISLAHGPLKVGIFTSEATTNNPATAAFASIPKIDPQVDFKAVISWFNNHGGFGGHKLTPVFYQPSASQTDFDTEEQAACDKFTQDDHVNLAISTNGADKLIRDCLRAKHVPLFMEFPGYYYRDLFNLYPGSIYGVALPEQQDLLWNWVLSLEAQGFFKNVAHPKVAIMMPTTDAGIEHIKQVVQPALARAGLTLDDIGSANSTSAISSAVLRFQTEGITHVLQMDVSGFTNTYYFMQDANTQGYHPRQAINSANTPDILRKNVPKSELAGSMGLSWIPILDTAAPPPDNAAAQQCNTIFKSAGIGYPTPTTKGALIWLCEVIQFANVVLSKAPATIDPANILSTIEGLGSSYIAARGGPTSFSPTKLTGGATYWDLQYSPAKGYYVIVGPPHQLEHWTLGEK